jgi:hypothetical protein
MSTFPNLSLSYNKKLINENKNENNNNISQTVIINGNNSSKEEILKKDVVEKVSTPETIKIFKDYLLQVLINYFKDEFVLMNNIAEFSKKIVFKEEHLKKLIAILVTENDETRIHIEYDVPEKICKCCQPCWKSFLYKEIKSIIIDNKNEFSIFYNQFHTQMGTEFNISLEYILS